MLDITIPASEGFDPVTEEFLIVKETKLVLEHSLLSVSKWEMKHHKAFLSGTTQLTREELTDYVKCMTVSSPPEDYVYLFLTDDNLKSVTEYIQDPMTATKINEQEGKGHSKAEIITNELIYYWMIANEIPFSCEKWHLNRLLTLIRVCSIKNQPPKKMSGKDQASRYRSTMAARRAKKPH